MRELTVEQITKTLLDAGLLSEEQRLEATIKERVQRQSLVHDARAKARSMGGSAPKLTDIGSVEVIASFGFAKAGSERGEKIGEETIMRALADQAGLEFRHIDPLQLDAKLMSRVVSRPFARRHGIVPLARDDRTITVAIANPFDDETIRNLATLTGYEVVPVVSTRTDILKVITEFYGFRSSVSAAEKELAPTVDLGNLEQLVALKNLDELEATDKHVITAVEFLLRYAYDQRASDLHIEPKRDQSLIRLRIDGVLHNVHTMPKVVHNALASRVKMLARLDITDRRLPQDGRFKTTTADQEVELRVSTLPVAFGEKIVIRIFDPESSGYSVERLGFFDREQRVFERMLDHPHGLILVTGPTGSGKTTTLYAGMRTLATEERNVTSIEDPIEMVIEDFNQVAVQAKIGIDFASALRHILRQDPDVIMIGEVRDGETATSAVQAALTGHLVLTTLHTNDSIEAVTRLVDLGVEPFLLSSSLIGVVAQRLLRVVCPGCKEERTLTNEQRRMLGLKDVGGKTIPMAIGTGCSRCRGTGYFGRTSVVEMFEVTDEIATLIRQGAPPEKLRKAAVKEGMRTLREAAVLKLVKGETTFEEVMRVTTAEQLGGTTPVARPVRPKTPEVA